MKYNFHQLLLKSVLPLCVMFLVCSSFTTSDDEVEQQRKYNYFFLEATRLKIQNNLAEAFDLYKHCLNIIPDAPSALYEIAQFYFMLNQVRAGEDALVKAVSIEPDNYWYSQALASVYQQQGKMEKAAQLLEEMVRRFSDKQEPFFGLLDIYNRTQNYEKMVSTIDSLEYRLGKSEQLTMEKSRIYMLMGNNKKAFDEIEGLVKEYPLDMRYLNMLGDAYMQNDEMKKAYATYQKVLSIEPKNPQALYALAAYYEKTGQPELYDAQIDTLLLNDNLDVTIKTTLMRQLIGRIQQQENADTLRIIRLFEGIMEQDKEDDVEIPVLYTQYLISRGMQEETIPVLEHILRLEPAHTQARMTLLGQALRKQDMEMVVRVCEPGIEVNPDVVEFYFYLGLAHYQLEHWDEALSVFQKALEVAPKTTSKDKELIADFYHMIGDIYHSKDENEKAYHAYDSALQNNPDNLGVLNNYAYYLSLQKTDLDKAEEMSYKTVKAEPDNSTYLDTYAWILFEKENYVQARIYIDMALQNGGEESDVIIEHAGDIYFYSGDTDKAIEYWQQAQEMGSESKTLERKIKEKKYIAE